MQINNNCSTTSFGNVRNTMDDPNSIKLLKKLSRKSRMSNFIANCHKQAENPVDVYFKKSSLGLWQGIIYKPGVAEKKVMVKWPCADILKFTEKVINKAEELKKHIFPAL